ncbi:MAG: replicative DNA helicase [Chlamydiae bacterium]|nr:MAG: replicative DNA helicase [Chlamydiota bacterium]
MKKSQYESKLSEKNIEQYVPPNNVLAEKCVLGGMITDEIVLVTAIDTLNSNSFCLPEHRQIFLAAENLYSKMAPVDIVNLTEELLKMGCCMEQACGAVYLKELIDSVPTTANYEYYIKIVHDKWLMRELISTANQIINNCKESNREVYKILGSTYHELFKIEKLSVCDEFKKLKSMMNQIAGHIKKLIDNNKSVIGLDTGFRELNELTTGFHDGELIILASQPAVGKTALALNIAENVAINENKAVAIFSLELTALELSMRILSSYVRIDAQKLRRGGLTQQDLSLLLQASAALKESSIYIDSSATLTPLEVRARCRWLKAENPNLGLIIIDYLQLMHSSASETENSEQELSQILRSLKSIALNFNVPIIVLSQLNRESENDSRPKLSQLRESGAIEQDADLVLLLYRKYMTSHDPKDENTAELIVTKQRNGPIGNILLKFENKYARFEDSPEGFAEMYYRDDE